jgi:IgGFc binding protein
MIIKYKDKLSELIKKIALTILIFSAFAVSDSKSVELDSRGNDFWLLFTPNVHRYYNTSGFRSKSDKDSLYLIVTSQFATTGTVTYNNGKGERILNFTIPKPNSVIELSFDYYDYELKPSNHFGVDNDVGSSDCEKISSKYFRVQSDDQISVHTINRALTTSEAALIYPDHALGKEHIILTYNNDARIGLLNTPSLFAILATEDNTEVEIIPSAPTKVNGSKTQNIKMNKGDTYLVEAALTNSSGNRRDYDLTGSRVNSNKPIAVFSGQQRANVPIENSDGSSRDLLYEQVPAVDRWGLNALLIPFKQVTTSTSGYSDIYRVVAAFDDTEVIINDTKTEDLNSGEYYEGKLDKVYRIKSNRPILTAVFKKTAQNSTTKYSSDPLMLFVPPVERFVSELIVTHIYANDAGAVESFDDYYLAIVSKKAESADVRVNGQPMTSPLYNIAERQDVPTTEYEYIVLDVKKHGYYHVKSPGKVGVYAYAYGWAISYGFTGGFESSSQDLNPPFLKASGECYEMEVIALDSSSYDSMLEKVEVPAADLDNVKIDYVDPPNLVPRITLGASLVDKHYDGRFKVIAIDSNKNQAEKFFDIPGFTIKLENGAETTDTVYYDNESIVSKEKCIQIELTNYGKFFHKVRLLETKLDPVSSLRTVTSDQVVDLSAGEAKDFEICFTFDHGGVFNDTIVIGDDCYSKVIIVTTKVGDDDTPPVFTSSSDPCGTKVTIMIEEEGDLNFGMKKFDVLVSENCDIDAIKTELMKYELSVTVADPYQDAIYSIRATDNSDNTSEYTDTIPGFTLALNDDLDKKIHIEFGELPVGNKYCDSVELTNYGMFDFVLDKPYVSENEYFSLTTHQYPLIIPSGESRKLTVCVKLNNINQEDMFDELIMEFNCVELRISLGGTAVEHVFDGETPCGSALKLKMLALPKEVMLGDVYPNPAKEKISSIIGLPEDAKVMIRVFDLHGNLKAEDQVEDYKAGLYEFSTELGNLDNGVYVYQIIVNGKKLSRNFTVIK